MARPTAAPGRRDRHPAGARADRVRLQALDRADPRLARDVRRARGVDRLPPPARPHVARERPPHGERRRVRAARPGYRARRLVEHERLVDLRRDGSRRPPVEVRDQLPGPAHLQPLELRARALLRASRAGARGSAGVLVGADVRVARARARAHRRRRARDPLAAAPRRDRGRLLAHVRGGRCRARRDGTRDDGGVAPRPDRRGRPVVAPRHLARGPRLPLLHDHRPADDPGEPARAPRVRRIGRVARDTAHRPLDERVLGEARRARRAHDRLRCAAAAADTSPAGLASAA